MCIFLPFLFLCNCDRGRECDTFYIAVASVVVVFVVFFKMLLLIMLLLLTLGIHLRWLGLRGRHIRQFIAKASKEDRLLTDAHDPQRNQQSSRQSSRGGWSDEHAEIVVAANHIADISGYHEDGGGVGGVYGGSGGGRGNSFARDHLQALSQRDCRKLQSMLSSKIIQVYH